MELKFTLRSPHRCDPREVRQLRDRLSALSLDLSSPLRALTSSRISRALGYAHSLLHTLPSHLDEVQRRTESASLFELRVAIFALIDSDQISDLEADQLAPLLRVIGVDELGPPLSRWLSAELRVYRSVDRALNEARVERGLAMLFHSDQGQAAFESLAEEERIELSGPWVRPMFRLASRELFPRQALLALYRSTSPLARPELIHQLERCRRQTRVAPLPAYELLLADLAESELDLLFSYLALHSELDVISDHLERLPNACARAFSAAKRAMERVC